MVANSNPVSILIVLVFCISAVWASVSDLRRREISNALVLGTLAVYFAIWCANGFGWVNLISSAGLFLLGFLCSLVFPRSLGMGDVKLLAVWTLGLGPIVVLAGLWIASVIGIAVVLARKKEHRRSPIPFAPFLSVGVALAMFIVPRILF